LAGFMRVFCLATPGLEAITARPPV
jgi:hypothetical protein